MAPRQIEDFTVSAGVSLQGKRIADVGCGDGIMALGVTHLVRPSLLVGFDINPVDTNILLERARRFGVADDLPQELVFRGSSPVSLPADAGEFDVVYTWSAFEHVEDTSGLLAEIRRVLNPAGTLMLQLWPFYYSALGSHLWEWFPEPFHHLVESDERTLAALRASNHATAERREYMAREYLGLNRITLDDLHRSILSAGFEVCKLELISHATTVPSEANRFPLSNLGVSGVKLLARLQPSLSAASLRSSAVGA